MISIAERPLVSPQINLEVELIRLDSKVCQSAICMASRAVAAISLGSFELGPWGATLERIQGLQAKQDTPAEHHVILELASVNGVKRFNYGSPSFDYRFDLGAPGEFHSEAYIISRVLRLYPRPETIYPQLECKAGVLINIHYTACLRAAIALANRETLHIEELRNIVHDEI